MIGSKVSALHGSGHGGDVRDLGEVHGGWINENLHWSLAVLSYLMTSWLWWFSSSFIKFWYFWINLCKQKDTFHIPYFWFFSAPQILAISFAWLPKARSIACFATAVVNCGFCSFWYSSIFSITGTTGSKFVSEPCAPTCSFIVLRGSPRFFANSSTTRSPSACSPRTYWPPARTIQLRPHASGSGPTIFSQPPPDILTFFCPNNYWIQWFLRRGPSRLTFSPLHVLWAFLLVYFFKVRLSFWPISSWPSPPPCTFRFFRIVFGECREFTWFSG